ncbi:Fe2OG dioxygenase domain-containing protein [Citrus sinensis]|uniref:hyoscyamine 6-dioxygenase-like n=1 Tax=Citrus sinensis TaxID=2711 RepID=UPI00218CB937|nr:hyoscyamine 6-dioxygenase-like [Citrus sinensis]KAH9729414.1 Fe2OG dioxygenase domain-containing protein [Citrus sinensis]
MEKLVSSWFNVRPLPEAYVFPPEQRPGKLFFPQGKSIPVLDLGGQDRKETIQLIMKASKEFGFFQVTNHGVSKDLIADTLALAKEFHAMPAEDKISECSKDPDRSCKLYTSSGKYATEEKHYWRDCLIHPSHSFEKYMQFWPAKPVRYREVIGKYSIEVRKLSSKILELLSEGLKLSSGYFSSDLSESPMLLINHYPPCPDPSLTLGLARHRDPGVVSIVLQGDVHGLQVFKDEEWIGVEPIPHAFVVNIGYVLQIISNGKLKGAEHRVVTNSTDARTTVSFFVYPSNDSLIEPEKALVNACDPPIYRALKFKDFHVDFLSKSADAEAVQKFISSRSIY